MNSKNFVYCHLAHILNFALGITVGLFNLSASAEVESSAAPAFVFRNAIP